MDANDPAEPEVAPDALAVTVTVNGEFVFELYVWLGVESDVAVVGVSPSPQSMSYSSAPPPTVVIVSVTVSPADPVVTSAVKSTDLTKVPLRMFSIVSFKSSMASAMEFSGSISV